MAQMALIIGSDGEPVLPPVSAEGFSDNTDNIEFRCCGLHNKCLAKCVLVRPSIHRNYFRAVEPHKKGCLNKSNRIINITKDDLTGEKFDKDHFFSRFKNEKKSKEKGKNTPPPTGSPESEEETELDLNTELRVKTRAISSVLKLFVVFSSHDLKTPYGKTVKEMRDLFLTEQTEDYHLNKRIMGNLIVKVDLHTVPRPEWLEKDSKYMWYMWMESVESETGKKLLIILKFNDKKIKHDVWTEFSSNIGGTALIVGSFWRYHGRMDAYMTEIHRLDSFVVIPSYVYEEIEENLND